MKRSIGFALTGVLHAFKRQVNFRRQVFLGVGAIVAGFVVSLSSVGWAILILTISLVLAAELLNTAIESVVDLVTQEHHESARAAKDTAAAVALVAAIGAGLVGIFLFGPKLLLLWHYY